MSRTRITVDVDPEVRRRIRLVIAEREETIKQFVERVIMRELDSEDEREYYLSEGGKPRGSKNPSRPRSGRTVAAAVIEDRR